MTLSLHERAEALERLRPCVARGAQFYDNRKPGWADKIDLSTLNLGDSCRCIVGQLEAQSYDQAIEGLGVPDPARYGFVVTDDTGEYDVLDELWGQQIAKRRTGTTEVAVRVELPALLTFDLEFGPSIKRREIEAYIRVKIREAIDDQASLTVTYPEHLED